jgi:hypothetical protein
MTAAIALPSARIAPRATTRTVVAAGAVVLAAILTVAGVVLAPYVLLGVFVAVAVVLGMAEIGKSVNQTFESLIALGD